MEDVTLIIQRRKAAPKGKKDSQRDSGTNLTYNKTLPFYLRGQKKKVKPDRRKKTAGSGKRNLKNGYLGERRKDQKLRTKKSKARKLPQKVRSVLNPLNNGKKRLRPPT